jgi:hypothetical protein
VVKCPWDTVIAELPSVGSRTRAVAWDRATNRMFFAANSIIGVYQDSMSGVEDRLASLPRVGLWLVANPASGVARLRCMVPAGEKAQVVVRDVLGRQVAVMEVPRGEGQVSVTWPGTDRGGQKVASGIYFAQLVADEQKAVVKTVLE